MQKKYIIIGTSAAGLSAAIKLRDLEPESSITCLTTEQEMPYNRCLLADFLSGNKPAERVATKPQEFFDEKNITLLRNARVVRIDRPNKRVLLHDSRAFFYDKLFIGTGRSGWIPKITGAHLSGVFPFYDLADVNNILAFIKEHQVTTATVVGAGLSGLECADALAVLGIQVNVIERAQHALPRQLDTEGGAFLAQLMQRANVTLYASDQLEEISGTDGFVSGVQLASKMKIPSQLVVFAIGGRVNSTLADTAGITLHAEGILVDGQMRTNDENILAGGDVCVVKDVLTGELVQSCLWADASMQGMAAACTMAGVDRTYPGTLVVTSSTIYGTTFVTCGPISNPPEHYEKTVRQGPDFYHTFLTHEGQLKGFAMIGKVNNVGMLRKKLVDKTPFEMVQI